MSAINQQIRNLSFSGIALQLAAHDLRDLLDGIKLVLHTLLFAAKILLFFET